MIITISGLHGSGKTEHAKLVYKFLKSKKYKVRYLNIVDISFLGIIKSFCQKPPIIGGWHACSIANDIQVVFEHAQNSTLNHQSKIGGILTFKRKESYQKEYGNFLYLLIRCFLFLIDLLIFLIYSLPYRLSRKKILLCDRYFYDKFANFDLTNVFFRAYWNVYKIFIPDPDIKFFLLIKAEEVFRRKPEYKLGFFIKLERSYSIINKKLKNIHIVKSKGIAKTQKIIETILNKHLSRG